ncbi:MAG: hypothetical protein BWY32_03478 [bacterium ADurb.Bin243]|nr:MAG: hypothetical protein BWY32_03478 [bacterium ADurb.Bin243]
MVNVPLLISVTPLAIVAVPAALIISVEPLFTVVFAFTVKAETVFVIDKLSTGLSIVKLVISAPAPLNITLEPSALTVPPRVASALVKVPPFTITPLETPFTFVIVPVLVIVPRLVIKPECVASALVIVPALLMILLFTIVPCVLLVVTPCMLFIIPAADTFNVQLSPSVRVFVAFTVRVFVKFIVPLVNVVLVDILMALAAELRE